ncbi:unnamed protein product, partial [Musa textilis]
GRRRRCPTALRCPREKKQRDSLRRWNPLFADLPGTAAHRPPATRSTTVAQSPRSQLLRCGEEQWAKEQRSESLQQHPRRSAALDLPSKQCSACARPS